MHVTIQEGRFRPELQRCTTCCDQYHCPFCTTSLFKPTYFCKVKKHVYGHLKKAVSHEGYTILRCGLQCRSQLHYHCVHCQRIVLRREPFLKHLRICKNKQSAVTFSATVAQETGVGGNADKKPDKDEQHGFLPVVSTSFSPPSRVDSRPSLHQEMKIAPKRKRQNHTEARFSVAHSTNCRDEDELFLLSLLPSMKRLTIKKRMEVRLKFQQVLYATEFEGEET